MNSKTQELIEQAMHNGAVIEHGYELNEIEKQKIKSLKADLEKCEEFWNMSIPFLQGQSKDEFIKSLMESAQNQRTKQDEENAKLRELLTDKLDTMNTHGKVDLIWVENVFRHLLEESKK